MATAEVIELLRCPTCEGGLIEDDSGFSCVECGTEYGSVLGIPDLRRLYKDPYLGRDEDIAVARQLAEVFDEHDFAGLLREHWRLVGKPPELAERFVAGDMAGPARCATWVDAVERQRGAAFGEADSFLEVGCGTAALAAVVGARAGRVVATDISIRWLVLAKKRMAEEGIENVTLVCCAAEAPCFPSGAFDVVGAADVIEHIERPEELVAGAERALKPGGLLFLTTPNRFSLSLEPHVRLWGVGYLPLTLARIYVQKVRKAPYNHVWLFSARRLRRLLRAGGLAPTIVPPEIPPATQAMYDGLELRLVRLYNRLRAFAPSRALLLLVGPLFHVFARKGPSS
jgi:SAM-dependent methyltransferase